MKIGLGRSSRRSSQLAILSLAALLLISCSTMQPPRYSVSVDNIQSLKMHQGAQVKVVSLYQSASYEPNCRLMGPIEPADGLTVPAFIAKAINDEFKMAGIYSEEGTTVTGDVTQIRFSSISGLTNGYWLISLDLQSSNGQALSVSHQHNFKSGFDAITACNATADALTPAVQDLIREVFSHPQFDDLL